jgi:hypothetical protein
LEKQLPVSSLYQAADEAEHGGKHQHDHPPRNSFKGEIEYFKQPFAGTRVCDEAEVLYSQDRRSCGEQSVEEFAKLCGAQALFGYFITLLVTRIVKFLGKTDGPPE